MIDSTQLGSIIMNYARYTEQKVSDRGQVNSFSDVLKSKGDASVDGARIQETVETEKVSLESMLKAKYPNLVYNVGDATSSAWRTRNDYPFEALFQEGEKATERIENWKPTGVNPKNQRYLPIAPGSKAVMIHPKAQERMARHAMFVQRWLQGSSDITLSGFSFMDVDSFVGSDFGGRNSMFAMRLGQLAEREIHKMLYNGLKEKLGDTICGMLTDEVIDGTWTDIEKGRSMRMSLVMM